MKIISSLIAIAALAGCAFAEAEENLAGGAVVQETVAVVDQTPNTPNTADSAVVVEQVTVTSFLQSLGMEQYVKAFDEEGFDTLEAVQRMTEDDLEAMGVKRGHRRKLQSGAEELEKVAKEAAKQAAKEAKESAKGAKKKSQDAGNLELKKVLIEKCPEQCAACNVTQAENMQQLSKAGFCLAAIDSTTATVECAEQLTVVRNFMETMKGGGKGGRKKRGKKGERGQQKGRGKGLRKGAATAEL